MSEAGINIPRTILRWVGVWVLLTCLIFFYNFINLPADPCRSMYPAIFWHIFCHSLLQSCPSACVLPGYDITTPIHSHFHPHVTLIHHFLHNLPHFAHVFVSPSRYHHNHMAIFTTEEEIALRKNIAYRRWNRYIKASFVTPTWSTRVWLQLNDISARYGQLHQNVNVCDWH